MFWENYETRAICSLVNSYPGFKIKYEGSLGFFKRLFSFFLFIFFDLFRKRPTPAILIPFWSLLILRGSKGGYSIWNHLSRGDRYVVLTATEEYMRSVDDHKALKNVFCYSVIRANVLSSRGSARRRKDPPVEILHYRTFIGRKKALNQFNLTEDDLYNDYVNEGRFPPDFHYDLI